MKTQISKTGLSRVGGKYPITIQSAVSRDVLHVIIHLTLKEVVYQVDENLSSLSRMSRI